MLTIRQSRSGSLRLLLTIIALFGLLGAGLYAQSCDIRYEASAFQPWSANPGKILLSGTYAYIQGGNFISIYDASDPALPRMAGQTENYIYTCGDGPYTTYDSALYPGDSILFLSTKCHGIVSYNIGLHPTNPLKTAGVNVQSCRVITSVKTNSARYLLLNVGTRWYFANFTNPGKVGQVKTYLTWNGLTTSATQAHAFEWQNHIYLAVNSLPNGFALYDISWFPSKPLLVFKVADLRSFGSAFNNGVLYVLGRSGLTSRYGLEMFAVPSGTQLGAYQGQGSEAFLQTSNVRVDDHYAYLGLGNCANTNAMDIVDIADPSAIHSILPDGFIPEFCENLRGVDFLSGQKDGIRYFMVSGSPEGDVYSMQNCPAATP